MLFPLTSSELDSESSIPVDRVWQLVSRLLLWQRTKFASTDRFPESRTAMFPSRFPSTWFPSLEQFAEDAMEMTSWRSSRRLVLYTVKFSEQRREVPVYGLL